MDLIDAFGVAAHMEDTGSMPHQMVKWFCLSDSNSLWKRTKEMPRRLLVKITKINTTVTPNCDGISVRSGLRGAIKRRPRLVALSLCLRRFE
jgi:hypothetical protein